MGQECSNRLIYTADFKVHFYTAFSFSIECLIKIYYIFRGNRKLKTHYKYAFKIDRANESLEL